LLGRRRSEQCSGPGKITTNEVKQATVDAALPDDGAHAIVADPGVAAPVIRALDEGGLTLAAIVLTHLHDDHNLGVPKLLERWAVPVHGPQLNEFDRRSQPPFPNPGTVPLDCVTSVVGESDSIALERPGIASG
jgi:hydroxyacylglutathione hydrolase